MGKGHTKERRYIQLNYGQLNTIAINCSVNTGRPKPVYTIIVRYAALSDIIVKFQKGLLNQLKVHFCSNICGALHRATKLSMKFSLNWCETLSRRLNSCFVAVGMGRVSI